MSMLPTTLFITVITLSVIKRLSSFAIAHFIKSMERTVIRTNQKCYLTRLFLVAHCHIYWDKPINPYAGVGNVKDKSFEHILPLHFAGGLYVAF